MKRQTVFDNIFAIDNYIIFAIIGGDTCLKLNSMRIPENEIEKAKRELADYMRRKENEDMERLQKGTEHNRR